MSLKYVLLDSVLSLPNSQGFKQQPDVAGI